MREPGQSEVWIADRVAVARRRKNVAMTTSARDE
jgi:hypothetical protein